jgi:hypothetical protein
MDCNWTRKKRIYLVERETHSNQYLVKCVMFEITFKKMHTINKLQDLLGFEEFKEPTKSHGIDLV